MNVYRGTQVWRTCSESENIFTDIQTTLGMNFFEDCLLLASKHFFKPKGRQIFSDTCYLITVTMHESNRPQALFFQQLSMWALLSFASLMLTFHLYFFLGFTRWHELPGNSLPLSGHLCFESNSGPVLQTEDTLGVPVNRRSAPAGTPHHLTSQPPKLQTASLLCLNEPSKCSRQEHT